MKKTGNKIRLGIFVSISVALFIAAIYFIGQRQQLFGTSFRISGIFKDIGGLQVGNNIRFSGINVGIVEDLEQVTDTTVKVHMLIDAHTQKFIKKNARAIIGSDGLMGNKIVIITPGSCNAKGIADNDTITTAMPVNMDDILLKLKVTGDNAAAITANMATIVGTVRSGKGTIGMLFMDTVLSQTFMETIINIKQGAGGFEQNMEAAKHNFFLKGFFKKKTVAPKKPADKN
jgi:phospholipid/cholesterol/gamma-HCH transport system substrate-binding protein